MLHRAAEFKAQTMLCNLGTAQAEWHCHSFQGKECCSLQGAAHHYHNHHRKTLEAIPLAGLDLVKNIQGLAPEWVHLGAEQSVRTVQGQPSDHLHNPMQKHNRQYDKHFKLHLSYDPSKPHACLPRCSQHSFSDCHIAPIGQKAACCVSPDKGTK